MNEKIRQYWEKKGIRVLSQNTPTAEITNVPIYYYHQNDTGPKIFIAAKWNDSYAYWHYPNWVTEEQMLEFINEA